MPLQPIQFATTSYKHDSLPLSAQRCVNAYCEFQPKDAKAITPVLGPPGITTWASVGDGPIRALFSMNGIGYAVSRDKFYSFDSSGVATQLGDNITGNTRVSITGNGIGNVGAQILIVNDALGFIYNTETGIYTQINDADFSPAATATFINGYFVLDKAGTNQFFVSNLLNGLQYSGLMYAAAESSPDRVIACWNRMGLLLIMGETTIEPWDHTGALSFPFQRIKGGTIDRGLSSPYAIVSEDMGLFLLGNDRVFYRMQGLQLDRISTHAIEREWETYPTVSDAFCFSVSYGGHKFIYVTFTTAQKTWCFDIATQLWHERVSYDPSGAEIKWRGNCSTQIYGKTLIGDANSNKIGYLDPTIYTEFGDTVIMTLMSPPFHANGQLAWLGKFVLEIAAGVGLTTGQGSDPQLMLDWSDDGGSTFQGPEIWASMGKIGERRTRLSWDRTGEFRERVMRVRISDPVKRTLIRALADIEVTDA